MVVKVCPERARCSGTLGSYKLGILDFDAFSGGVFFCFARSCRIVEKFDENHRNLLKNSYLVLSEHQNRACRVRKSPGSDQNVQ